MKLCSSVLVTFVLFVCPVSILAQEAKSDLAGKIDSYIREAIEAFSLPGFSAGVIVDGELIFARSYGVKELGKDDPVTTRTLFHMASVTKPFVATSIMQLVEKGKVDLDDTVFTYLPYFKLADERYKTITVRQMLSHISGMPDVRDYEWDKPVYDDGALERYVRSLSNHTLLDAPGESFSYSNMAFEVLGDLIAKVSGETFEDYVQKNILDPVGMKDSTLLNKKADRDLLSSPHVIDSDGKPIVSEVFPYNRMHAPSSTLYSNIEDMARWAQINMNRGELDGKRILKESSYAEMWKKYDNPQFSAGLSWFISTYKGHPAISHGGGDVGFRSFIQMLPEKKIAMFMMGNYSRTPTGQLFQGLLDIALGYEPPVVRVPISLPLYSILQKEGIEAAIALYNKLKKEQPEKYSFAETELNSLGYYLLNSDRIDEAIEIFELNVKMYPNASNPYDSLGEAYMKAGNKELAIKNYEKSLELNPRNQNAVETLKRLKEEK